jgi:hypothetical protein
VIVPPIGDFESYVFDPIFRLAAGQQEFLQAPDGEFIF